MQRTPNHLWSLIFVTGIAQKMKFSEKPELLLFVGVFRTQLNIYGGTFLQKWLTAAKSSILDVQLVSKYASSKKQQQQKPKTKKQTETKSVTVNKITFRFLWL